jgi:hypothetical protein
MHNAQVEIPEPLVSRTEGTDFLKGASDDLVEPSSEPGHLVLIRLLGQVVQP